MMLVMSLGLALQWDPAELDRERITAHLRQTEADLRARDVSGLGAQQRRARAENLDALHGYWVRGVYPHNHYVPGQRVPVFIDDDGRACAVGQLMIESGALELALEVAASERLEYVATIETKGVIAWAEASGLTLTELARIQPSYCGCGDEPVEPVCGADGNTYPNTCLSWCAGVKVEQQGPCPGSSESGDGITDGATTGESGSSSSGTSSTTADDPSSSTTGGGSGSAGAPSTSTGASSTSDAAVDSSSGLPQGQARGSGCRIGGAGSSAWLVLALLGWRRRP